MIIIRQCARGAVHFHLLSGSTENSIAFFRRGWRDDPAHPISVSGLKPAPKTAAPVASELSGPARGQG
jgi:hypothetical protein